MELNKKIVDVIENRDKQGKRFTIIAVAEGAISKQDAKMTKKEYKKKPKKEINKSVKLPTWFDNEQKDINVSEEEKKEIEALLKEFK